MQHSQLIQRRSGGSPIRGLIALLTTIGVALSVAVLPAAALAASPAKVQIEPAEQTSAGFKLKAKVNPEGSATTYYFIYKQAGEVECEDLEGCGPETPKGGPLTGDTPQEVQAEVTGLTPGTNYIYWLIARNAFSEDVRSASLGFTTPPAAPSIETESVSYVTHDDATLEATINSKELAEGAYYQFQLVKSPSEYLPELTCPEPEVLPPSNPDGCTSPDSSPHTLGALPIGYIAKEPQGQSVSLDIATAGVTLQPSTTYHYRVLVAKRVQSEDTVDWGGPFVAGPDQTFTTPPPPAIESTSVSNVTEHDATLEAQIDTEGLETSYQFRLSAICGGKGACLVVVNYPLPSGLLLGSFVDQSVSLDLNAAGVTLQPGGTYTYSLSATNASGTTESAPHNFTTPENVVQPLTTTTTSPLSGSGQPAGSNSGDQPTGSGGSPTPGVTPLGPQMCLCNCARGCHGKKVSFEHPTRTQKLSKALKICKKKSKKQRPSCKRQAEKKYSAPSKHRVGGH
jgi:hypothetical protein